MDQSLPQQILEPPMEECLPPQVFQSPMEEHLTSAGIWTSNGRTPTLTGTLTSNGGTSSLAGTWTSHGRMPNLGSGIWTSNRRTPVLCPVLFEHWPKEVLFYGQAPEPLAEERYSWKTFVLVKANRWLLTEGSGVPEMKSVSEQGYKTSVAYWLACWSDMQQP